MANLMNFFIKKYIDEEDALTLLAEKLEYSEQFKGAEFWIDGFTGFTPKQYKVLEKLLKKSCQSKCHSHNGHIERFNR